MIIEHSGDFKVVHPKTKEVRYDSNYWEKHYDEEGVTIKDQILKLLKGETFYVIKNILEEVFEEVQEKARY